MENLPLMQMLPLLTSWLSNQTSHFLNGLPIPYLYEFRYIVVIDAGSSGTRISAYKFKVPKFTVLNGNASLELVDEYYHETEPGLSSYAADPAEGADTVYQLIDQAEYFIPLEQRSITPIIVRATAGLRLLPKDVAQTLLDHVTEALLRLNYNMDKDAVAIMDGSDEGICSWLTINLLLNLLDGVTEPQAALDLGGGSTQITYQVTQSETQNFPPADIHQVPFGNRNLTVYSHSYLKLGMYAARHGIFRMEAENDETNDFVSVCVSPGVVSQSWLYLNKLYSVSGAPRQTSDPKKIYDTCRSLVLKYLAKTMDWEPMQPPKGTTAIFASFHRIAVHADIIAVDAEGGMTTVDEFRKRAYEWCSTYKEEEPWACIDLVYVVALLQDGYKIGDDDDIYIYRKINGHEVSWTLGLAYTTLLKRIAAGVVGPIMKVVQFNGPITWLQYGQDL